jgi:alkyl hydroperoxide reductase subunit AhpC
VARTGNAILDAGDEFPSLAVATVADGTVTLPDAFGDDWGVLLFYRAHW